MEWHTWDGHLVSPGLLEELKSGRTVLRGGAVMALAKVKTEHGGAKNEDRGYTRQEAKEASRKLRRLEDKREAKA